MKRLIHCAAVITVAVPALFLLWLAWDSKSTSARLTFEVGSLTILEPYSIIVETAFALVAFGCALGVVFIPKRRFLVWACGVSVIIFSGFAFHFHSIA